MSKKTNNILVIIATIVLSLIIGIIAFQGIRVYLKIRKEVREFFVILEAPQEAENVVLTERQKRILEEEGLPTEYEELNFTQKMAIMDIEEMLVATEEKYGISFEYLGFRQDYFLKEEHILTAYPTGGDKVEDKFTVTRRWNADGEVYSDTYACRHLDPVYQKFIEKYVYQKLGEGHAKIYSMVYNVVDDDWTIDESQIPHHVDGGVSIFVNNDVISEEQYEEFVTEFIDWGEENSILNNVQIFLLSDEIYQEVNEDNYMDYYSKQDYIRREDYSTWSETRVTVE